MTTFRTPLFRGLYAVTDGPRADLLEVAALALEGGTRMLQYRDLSRDTPRRHLEALALAQLCRAHDVPLIIDHDMALAVEVGAGGVHLGGDEDPAAARRVMGEQAIIGVSCYDSLARAEAATRAGASYVSFGAFFPSSTKPLASLAPLELLRQSAALGIARVAIGGITPDNGRSLVEAGADCLAVVAAVFATTDVRAAAQRFTDLYSSDREPA
ncbi:thiamine-phosphate pyrophosphorylase [Rhodanobacter sp. TND4EL1]